MEYTLVSRNNILGDPWVAQWFSVCLRPTAQSWRPGIESCVGLLAWSLLLSLSLSLSVCLSWINFKKRSNILDFYVAKQINLKFAKKKVRNRTSFITLMNTNKHICWKNTTYLSWLYAHIWEQSYRRWKRRMQGDRCLWVWRVVRLGWGWRRKFK